MPGRLGSLRLSLAHRICGPGRHRLPWGAMAEVIAIVLWAMWVGRSYLNFRPDAIPMGLHFGEVLPHWVWTLFWRCGDCVLWNGYSNGGSPAFADIHGNVLHPLVIIPVLIWGGLNGTKVALVCGFAMAGLAQWGVARALRLGRLARLWSAALAVVGGHLAGRMEDGVFPLLFATAAVSMVLGPGIELALTAKRRAAIGFAFALALAILSTQGYLLLGLAFCILPAFAVFLPDSKLHIKPIWKEFALALGLALLLSGIFWVPLVHVWPQFAKDADPNFRSAQPIEYAVLNLVIRDVSFFRSDALTKQPFPFLYLNYIGWVPVLLAIAGIRLVPRSGRRILAFLCVAVLLVYLAGSALIFKALALVLPTVAAGVRNSVVICGLAAPLILGLAGWGLDLLLQLKWPRLSLTPSDQVDSRTPAGLRLSWLLLVPLAWSIKSAYDLGHTWVGSTLINETDQRVLDALKTDSSQWVTPPFGEHYWMPFAYQAGLKVSPLIRPWHWHNRELPSAYLEATRQKKDYSTPGVVKTFGDITLLVHEENEYAAVETEAGAIPCRAQALGGHISVDCESDVPGTLVVHESQWTGWTAKRDGLPLKLNPSQWLSVPAVEGRHHYEFRYRPWDVAVGLFLSLVGVILSLILGAKRSPTRAGAPH